MNFKEYVKDHVVVTDGAMGTYYGSLFSHEDILVEKENELHPQRIQQIHLEYLQAGARLLRTNTFATNANFFESMDAITNNIRAAFSIARSAVEEFASDEPVFLAADIGTIYDLTGAEHKDVIREYQGIIDAFLAQGADIFLFETQADFYYIQPLVQYIKEHKPDAYVMVSFSFDKTGYTKAGIGLQRMMDVMCGMEEVDAYGLNCGMEGAHMYQMLEQVTFPTDKTFFALPNAGYPYVLRGKTIYGKNEAYFLKMQEKILSLGVDMVGGCCGTTPSYITGTKALVDTHQRSHKSLVRKPLPGAGDASSQRDGKQPEESSAFLEKCNRGEMPFVVELDPPSDVQVEKLFTGAKLLKEHNIDLLTLSDSPMARGRMDASLLGCRIQKEVGITVMPHISCRDRNVISMRGTMLGDYVNDMRHFLVVTGDPVAKPDRSTITQVFDYNSIKFMGLLKEMNQEQFASCPVIYGGALNYHGANMDAIARRMELKMEQGCSFFLTQPIYSDEDVQRISDLKEKTGAKILGGIMPLVSKKNALFIANEMPGMHVPQEILDAYHQDMSREEAEAVAVQVSVEIAKKLKPVVDGFYFMTPFNRVGLICNIVETIRERVLGNE